MVPFEIAGVISGNVTRGHRFLSTGPIEVRRFEDYEKKLRDAHVILDGAERREIILHEAKQKAFALGLELIEDEGLANEVMGLAEWPVVLIGRSIRISWMCRRRFFRPPCARIRNILRLRDPARGKLANRFALVSNMAADDGGKRDRRRQ